MATSVERPKFDAGVDRNRTRLRIQAACTTICERVKDRPVQEISDFRAFWIHQRNLASRRLRNFEHEDMAKEKLAQARKLAVNIRRIDGIVAGYALDKD